MRKAKILSLTLVCLLVLVCLFSSCAFLQGLGDQVVTSGYFEFASIEKSEALETTTLSVISSCPVSIYKYEASLIFVNEYDQEFYETETVIKEVEIPANEEFQINFTASNDLITDATRFKLKIQGRSKERLSSLENEEYQVTFKYGARVIEVQTVKFGESPTLPQMEYVGNEYFHSWCKDKSLSTQVEPDSQKIYRDTTYYAKYVPDLDKVDTQVHNDGLPSVVTIKTQQAGWGINGYAQLATQGSGVIVKIEDGKAYALTNAHVVHSAGMSLLDVEITDCFNRIYKAKMSSLDGTVALRTDYDLALLEFDIIDDKLCAVKMADSNPSLNACVVAVGTPEGMRNSVTYGECVTYQKATGEVNLGFDVLWHNADITHGSSGGALFNSSVELVGINYAGTDDKEQSYGIAIPITKVKEFISSYTKITIE
ncbi:MAG: trypsin-like peptidase domain-containing protein [Clostridia bacterium]|nr:trypsin-like peptidase domain-containing protein [Clostridia bacterium]